MEQSGWHVDALMHVSIQHLCTHCMGSTSISSLLHVQSSCILSFPPNWELQTALSWCKIQHRACWTAEIYHELKEPVPIFRTKGAACVCSPLDLKLSWKFSVKRQAVCFLQLVSFFRFMSQYWSVLLWIIHNHMGVCELCGPDRVFNWNITQMRKLLHELKL